MISQYQRELAEASYSSQISGAGLTGWFSFQAAQYLQQETSAPFTQLLSKGYGCFATCMSGPHPQKELQEDIITTK